MNRTDGRSLLRALAGLGVWALCFVVLYAGVSLGCQVGLGAKRWGDMNALSLLLALMWLVHAIWLGGLAWRAWRGLRISRSAGTDRFIPTVILGLDVAACGALTALLVPIVVLMPCA